MTRGRLAVVVVSALAVVGCTQRTPEMQVVHDAAEALGGDDDVFEATNFILTGSGQQYRVGQSHRPDDDPPFWEIDEFQQTVDLEGARWQITQERTSAYLTPVPLLREPQTLGLDGDVAYELDADGSGRRLSEDVAAERVAALYHHPLALLQLAMRDGSTVTKLREEDGQDIVDVVAPDGTVYTLWVDEETAYTRQIASAGHHPILGDVTYTTTFDDYWETGGLGGFSVRFTLPRRITSRIDDWPTWELRVTSAVNQTLDDVGAPESVRTAAAPSLVPNIEVRDVANGVWCLAGQSHHSVVVEFADFLVLIEAPHSEARTLAVIETARELSPDKPLQYVVNTHHHLDHAAGLRAAVSEGLTLITHETNAEFVEALVARPFTRRPDSLSANPQPLELELVTGFEAYELSDGRRTLELVSIFQDEHSAGNLMAYLPRERVLIQADAYIPGMSVAPFAPTLLKNVTDLEWRVDSIVPIHGEPVDLEALEEAAAAEGSRI